MNAITKICKPKNNKTCDMLIENSSNYYNNTAMENRDHIKVIISLDLSLL